MTPLRAVLFDLDGTLLDTAPESAGTRLFPGMEQVLETLVRRHLKVGIVTNKAAWLTGRRRLPGTGPGSADLARRQRPPTRHRRRARPIERGRF